MSARGRQPGGTALASETWAAPGLGPESADGKEQVAVGDGGIRRGDSPADVENMYTAPLGPPPGPPAAHGSTGRPAPRQTSGGPMPQPAAVGMADPSAPRMPHGN